MMPGKMINHKRKNFIGSNTWILTSEDRNKARKTQAGIIITTIR
jgi:hypothetical protein